MDTTVKRPNTRAEAEALGGPVLGKLFMENWSLGKWIRGREGLIKTLEQAASKAQEEYIAAKVQPDPLLTLEHVAAKAQLDLAQERFHLVEDKKRHAQVK